MLAPDVTEERSRPMSGSFMPYAMEPDRPLGFDMNPISGQDGRENECRR